MFKPSEKKHTYIDDEIARATAKIQEHDVDSDEYGAILDRITQLQKIRNDERDAYLSQIPDVNTVVNVAANLIGIALIINHERVNYLASAALPFVKKP